MIDPLTVYLAFDADERLWLATTGDKAPIHVYETLEEALFATASMLRADRFAGDRAIEFTVLRDTVEGDAGAEAELARMDEFRWTLH